MHRKSYTFLYLFSDFIAAIIVWFSFFSYRKLVIESQLYEIPSVLNLDRNLVAGLIFIPIFWISIFAFSGMYKDVLRKPRLNEFFKTFIVCLLGVTILFFLLVLDDTILSTSTYYQYFALLFGLQLSITFIGRFIILSNIDKKKKNGTIAFNTLIIGGNEKAVNLLSEINDNLGTFAYNIVGFVDTGSNGKPKLNESKKQLGLLDDIPNLLESLKIEEVIIALEENEHDLFRRVLNLLREKEVKINVIPDMYEIMLGLVKMEQIFGAILIEVKPGVMPVWQQIVKRVIDISVSCISMLLLMPLMLYIALRIRVSSSGPIFYLQERIGFKGKPFNIYKFRSMIVESEVNGPALSSTHDARITSWGKVMRKWRFDELPQFVNVLKGDMSLVGYRPERQFFIDKIMEQAPHYRQLFRIKPGITSWGQVKYGYAENVNQMVERLKFDILYIENMSLLVDLKIMLYTILIIFKGRGK